MVGTAAATAVVNRVSWEQDELAKMSWLTVDHPSSYHAHNPAVLGASQTSSTSDPSDPATVTRA